MYYSEFCSSLVDNHGEKFYLIGIAVSGKKIKGLLDLNSEKIYLCMRVLSISKRRRNIKNILEYSGRKIFYAPWFYMKTAYIKEISKNKYFSDFDYNIFRRILTPNGKSRLEELKK